MGGTFDNKNNELTTPASADLCDLRVSVDAESVTKDLPGPPNLKTSSKSGLPIAWITGSTTSPSL